jgi:hypothetical protein
MMVATKEGQWNPKLFEDRDNRYCYDTESIKKIRAEVMPVVKVNPKADQFQM